jgi:hypothetical protein
MVLGKLTLVDPSISVAVVEEAWDGRDLRRPDGS